MTDGEKSKIIDDMVIICDTRERKNDHILDYFKENGIKYRIEKLDTADYSMVFPNYPEIGLDRKILVERKGSLDEICGNLTKDRDRFIREFERVKDEHLHLVLENFTWKKIMAGSYRSQFDPKAFTASLLTLSIRYGCQMWFTTPKETPSVLYGVLYYELREHLKKF